MAVSSGMAFSVRPPAPAARPCAASAAAGGSRMRADGGGAKWWAPLLGWSGQPDYINAQPAAEAEEPPPPQTLAGAARRFSVLTEDKARRLRMQMQMMETETGFSDVRVERDGRQGGFLKLLIDD